MYQQIYDVAMTSAANREGILLTQNEGDDEVEEFDDKTVLIMTVIGGLIVLIGVITVTLCCVLKRKRTQTGSDDEAEDGASELPRRHQPISQHSDRSGGQNTGIRGWGLRDQQQIDPQDAHRPVRSPAQNSRLNKMNNMH